VRRFKPDAVDEENAVQDDWSNHNRGFPFPAAVRSDRQSQRRAGSQVSGRREADVSCDQLSLADERRFLNTHVPGQSPCTQRSPNSYSIPVHDGELQAAPAIVSLAPFHLSHSTPIEYRKLLDSTSIAGDTI
jgi:hypothetical protein